MDDNKNLTKKYFPLTLAAGIGSMLGSGIIIGFSATLPVWEQGLNLTTGEVGIVSGALTFAIAAGSFAAGKLENMFGLIKSFNWLNFVYAIGAVLIMFSSGFTSLLIGAVIMGVSSGADLPISLTVVSQDAPNEKTSASLVSSTQIFWQIGVFISYIAAFLVSGIDGTLGARLVFGLLLFISLFTWFWRMVSPKLKQFHKEAKLRLATANLSDSEDEKLSLSNIFKGQKKFLYFFIAVLVFYVFWNLLANTWGQFQTYALTNTGATQTQATGLGIILNIVTLVTTIVFSSVAGGKYRNVTFVLGGIIQFSAMLVMAFYGGEAGFIALAITIALYNVGNPLAGEAIYKVWTQELFPPKARASVQGFTNGFSRLCTGVFALVTPILIQPDRIQTTMIGFAGVVLVAIISGIIIIRLQKKYNTDYSE